MAGDIIDLTTAIKWCANFRKDFPNDIKAHNLSSSFFNDILHQENCAGIRMYNAIDDEGAKCIVLVGTDENGKDITDGCIIDRGDPCPNHCDSSSPLNGGE